MYAVQKRDFFGQWVDIYRAYVFTDAERFRKSHAGGTAAEETRIIQV